MKAILLISSLLILSLHLAILVVPAISAETDNVAQRYDYAEVKSTAQELGLGTPDSDKTFELMVGYRTMQERNKLYESILLTVALLVSLVVVLRYITSNPDYSASHLVNASGLIFIIFGTIFLVLLTDSESQLTASMGIMGAIAGYLFGTMRRPEEKKRFKEDS